jgi:hypothetical protein
MTFQAVKITKTMIMHFYFYQSTMHGSPQQMLLISFLSFMKANSFGKQKKKKGLKEAGQTSCTITVDIQDTKN